jgi:hypothetical protein
LQKLVGGNYGAIYSSGVTPSATNYTMITDGAAVNFNGTSGVYFNISNTNKIQVTANNINIVPTAASTSTSTGAFTVAGGVGIGGSLYVASATAISGVTINNGVIIGSLTGTATTATYSNQSGYGITAGLATTATYSHQAGYAITSGSASIATTATYSHQAGYAITSGSASIATTSTYSHQAGYAITSGSSGTANTATYSHQSGYGSTSGFATTASYSYQSGYGITSGFATTSTYSQQSGYGITSGLATTSTYSHQAGYGITAGLATTSTYSHQSGYGITAGLATTAQTLNTVAASTNATHYVLFSPVNGGSGVAVSSDSGLTFNPSSNTVSLSTLAATTVSTSTASITGSTASTSPTTGALVVTGGVGIGGSLYVAGDLTINGTTTTINSVTLTVDDKNIELGSVSTPSDVTAEGGGITLKGATDKSINWYTGTGWSSSESWNLASGNTYKINNTTVLSNSSLGTGVTNSSLTAVGTISTGVWSGTLITSLYGGTGFNSYTKGDLLVGAGTTLIKHAVGSQNQILIADLFSGSGLSWATFANPTYGSFYSTSTQQVAGAGVSTPVNFNATYESNRVSIFGGAGTSSRIQIQDAGPYSITFSAQINLVTGNSFSNGEFWFRVNGQDLPQSNSSMSISGKDFETLLTVNFVYTFANNDYFEIIMSSLDTQFSIEYQSGLTNPPRPNTPSIILSVLPITHIVGASGSGISGILSLNGSTASQQYFLTGTSGSNFNVSTASGNHTFNIPIAGTGATGLLTSQNQTIGGLKTFASGISITASTASTSTTTGALVVTGGVGIGGSIFGGSTISAADNIEIRSAKELRLNNSGNTFYTGFKAGANTANAVYTFPTAYPGTGTSILQSDTSGVLTWVPLASVGNTIQNIVVNNAGNANVFHPILFTPSSLSAGSAVSSDTTITFNSSTDILNVSGLAVTSGTASTNTTTGALVVRGGLGVTGQLSFASASFGFTGIATNPTMSFIGATTSSPITLTVLTDNSLNFEGSQGSVFSIDNNLSSGEIFSVSDISGLPIISASAGQTVNINEFGGYTQIGNGSLNSSSTSNGSLVIAGGLGVTGNAYIGGTTNITNTSNSSSTTSGALVVNGGVGITGNANIGGTVRLTNTTASISSSTGSLTVSGGVGIGQTLFVGGSISNANYFYSGGNNFTKSGQAQGDILLDNNANDTPGVLYYYKNNTNFGTDVFATGTGSTRYRIVRDLNESGGSELWSIDRPGEIIKMTVLVGADLTGGSTTTISTSSDTDVASYSYTPVSSNSYLVIEFTTRYFVVGAAADDYVSRIAVDGAEQSYNVQVWTNGAGGGTRSGTLFPLMARYTNSNTTAKTISATVRKGTTDDNATVYKDTTTVMKITEIGR